MISPTSIAGGGRLRAAAALLATSLVAGVALAGPMPAGVALSAQEALQAPPAAAAPDGAAAPAEPEPLFTDRIVYEGIGVDVAVLPAAPGGALREGDAVRVRFTIRDTHTDSPLGKAYPAAWMDLLPDPPPANPDSCKTKVQAFVGGTLLAQPELDLNVYYVLALNEDPTISVVDPLFGFGGSKLLAMIFLRSAGGDWALAPDGERLFVSLPDSDQVAVIETATWKVVTYIDTGPRPRRVAIQPDGHYLWVGYEQPFAGDEVSGVTVINAQGLKAATHLRTGAGEHDLAFSDDNRFAFVTNRESGTVSVVDVRAVEKVRDLQTGGQPVSIAYSPLGQAAYVSHLDGTVAVVDGRSGELVTRLTAEPGLGQIRFAPDGRLGFVVNPRTNYVHVVDASVRRIIQSGEVESEPDQIGFSDELAYIRHRGSGTILMIPLDQLGREGAPLPVVDFPGGRHPPGEGVAPTPAAGIVQAPGATAVLVSNAPDQAIYYYKEGMAAPMGQFQNYDRAPRAVAVVDRSLRERAPGVYETTVTLRRPGKYDLALFLDSPRLVHCFPLTVEVNPDFATQREGSPIEVVFAPLDPQVPVGREVTVRFRLRDRRTGESLTGRDDVRLFTFLVPGTLQRRHPATAGEEGWYEVAFTPPEEGVFYLFAEVPGAGLRVQDAPPLVLQAVPP